MVKRNSGQGMPLKGVKDETRVFAVTVAVSTARLMEMLGKEGMASVVIGVRRLNDDDVDKIKESRSAAEDLDEELNPEDEDNDEAGGY